MTFEEFSEQVRASNLVPRECSPIHWQIRGGKFCVNFYPLKNGGPSFYVNGMNSGWEATASGHCCTVADAIVAADKPPINLCSYARKRKRKRSYKGAKKRLLRASPFCYWCKKKLDTSSSTLDHMIPLSKGGTNGTDNFVLACEDCNKNRGNDMPKRTEWSKFLS